MCVVFWTTDVLLVLFAGGYVSTGLLAFFLFQENLQLALCVELHPRIQAGQALRKENSCQTMNYCAVTRQVPFWGVDEEAGSVSRITHSHAVSRVLMHTRLNADACEFTHGEAKTNLEPNRFNYLDGTLARVVSQHNINPVKVKHKHPMFATTVQPWEEVEENLSLSQNAVPFLAFSGSERSEQLTLAAARLCSANNAHPQTDPRELSRRLHTSMSEPGDLSLTWLLGTGTQAP